MHDEQIVPESAPPSAHEPRRRASRPGWLSEVSHLEDALQAAHRGHCGRKIWFSHGRRAGESTSACNQRAATEYAGGPDGQATI